MTIGTVLAIIFSAGWATFFVFRTEPYTEAFSQYSRAERVSVSLTPVVFTAHITAACITLTLSAIAPLPAAMSLLAFAGAMAFWFWGRLLISPLDVKRLPDQPPLQLRRDGAFGIVRHPLYLAYALASGAPLIVAPRPWLVASYALCVIAIATRAVQEERRLLSQLGATYAAYCREVKRLIPFVW